MAARVGNEKGTRVFSSPCMVSYMCWGETFRGLGPKGGAKILCTRAGPFATDCWSGLFPDRCMDGH